MSDSKEQAAQLTTLSTGSQRGDFATINRVACWQAEGVDQSLKSWGAARVKELGLTSCAQPLLEYLKNPSERADVYGAAESLTEKPVNSAFAADLAKGILTLVGFLGSNQDNKYGDSPDWINSESAIAPLWIPILLEKGKDAPTYAQAIVDTAQRQWQRAKDLVGKDLPQFKSDDDLDCLVQQMRYNREFEGSGKKRDPAITGSVTQEEITTAYFTLLTSKEFQDKVDQTFARNARFSSIRSCYNWFAKNPKKSLPLTLLTLAFVGCATASGVEAKTWAGFGNALNIKNSGHVLGKVTVALGVVLVLYCVGLLVSEGCSQANSRQPTVAK